MTRLWNFWELIESTAYNNSSKCWRFSKYFFYLISLRSLKNVRYELFYLWQTSITPSTFYYKLMFLKPFYKTHILTENRIYFEIFLPWYEVCVSNVNKAFYMFQMSVAQKRSLRDFETTIHFYCESNCLTISELC